MAGQSDQDDILLHSSLSSSSSLSSPASTPPTSIATSPVERLTKRLCKTAPRITPSRVITEDQGDLALQIEQQLSIQDLVNGFSYSELGFFERRPTHDSKVERGRIQRQRLFRQGDAIAVDIRESSLSSALELPAFPDTDLCSRDIDVEEYVQDLIENLPAQKTARYIISHNPTTTVRKSLGIKRYIDAGERLLRSRKHLPGIQSPYLYISIDGHTVSCAHGEDCDLWSQSLLHAGAPKIWIIVKPHHKDKFECCLKDSRRLYPTTICDQYVRHQQVVISPSVLRSWEVEFSICVQIPGTVVITLPRAPHWTINDGNNIAEAVNWAEPKWNVPLRYVDCSSHEPNQIKRADFDWTENARPYEGSDPDEPTVPASRSQSTQDKSRSKMRSKLSLSLKKPPARSKKSARFLNRLRNPNLFSLHNDEEEDCSDDGDDEANDDGDGDDEGNESEGNESERHESEGNDENANLNQDSDENTNCAIESHVIPTNSLTLDSTNNFCQNGNESAPAQGPNNVAVNDQNGQDLCHEHVDRTHRTAIGRRDTCENEDPGVLRGGSDSEAFAGFQLDTEHGDNEVTAVDSWETDIEIPQSVEGYRTSSANRDDNERCVFDEQSLESSHANEEMRHDCGIGDRPDTCASVSICDTHEDGYATTVRTSAACTGEANSHSLKRPINTTAERSPAKKQKLILNIKEAVFKLGNTWKKAYEMVEGEIGFNPVFFLLAYELGSRQVLLGLKRNLRTLRTSSDANFIRDVKKLSTNFFHGYENYEGIGDVGYFGMLYNAQRLYEQSEILTMRKRELYNQDRLIMGVGRGIATIVLEELAESKLQPIIRKASQIIRKGKKLSSLEKLFPFPIALMVPTRSVPSTLEPKVMVGPELLFKMGEAEINLLSKILVKTRQDLYSYTDCKAMDAIRTQSVVDLPLTKVERAEDKSILEGQFDTEKFFTLLEPFIV